VRGRALPGAALGVGAWAGAAALGLGWTGWCALLVGGLAGLSARLLGARGTTEPIPSAVLAFLGIAVGLGFASEGALAAELRARAGAVSRKDYDEFGKAAAAWDPRMAASDRGKFGQAWGLLPGSALGGPAARIAAFEREVVPELEAWKKSPPEFEAWREARRAAILRGAESPWSAYLRDPLRFVSALDLLCAAAGIAAAAVLPRRKEAAVIVRRVRDPGSRADPSPPI
jgi:hypothetical protein